VNSEVCQHDIEYIYEAYNQREGEFSWEKHIVTGLLTTPDSVNVDEDATVSFVVDKLKFARSQQGDTDPGSTNFFYSTTPSGLATGTNEVLTGEDDGIGVLNVNVALPQQSQYLEGTTLFAKHHQVPLVVNPPPCDPGNPPLRVTAITADQEPAITSVGSHSFSATHVGCPAGEDMWFDWTFDPSAIGMPTTTIDSVGANVSYPVAGGNYTITVTALPSDSTGAGFPLIRYVNVCTDPPGGGLQLLQGPGDPGTDAVGGCGGGELP
jgi:hypothetical protein